MTEPDPAPSQRVLIVGAGIAGMQAALDIAGSGVPVVLVDRLPSVGGHMHQLSETFPTLEDALDSGLEIGCVLFVDETTRVTHVARRFWERSPREQAAIIPVDFQGQVWKVGDQGQPLPVANVQSRPSPLYASSFSRRSLSASRGDGRDCTLATGSG